MSRQATGQDVPAHGLTDTAYVTRLSAFGHCKDFIRKCNRIKKGIKVNRKAFTLIELLVVIAIIALLMSVVMPSLRKAKDAAKVMVCASNQHQCLVGVLGYAASNDGIMPPAIMKTTAGMAAAGTPHSWTNLINYHPGNPVADNSGALYTYLGDYLPDVHVFMCPMGFCGRPVSPMCSIIRPSGGDIRNQEEIVCV